MQIARGQGQASTTLGPIHAPRQLRTVPCIRVRGALVSTIVPPLVTNIHVCPILQQVATSNGSMARPSDQVMGWAHSFWLPKAAGTNFWQIIAYRWEESRILSFWGSSSMFLFKCGAISMSREDFIPHNWTVDVCEGILKLQFNYLTEY